MPTFTGHLTVNDIKRDIARLVLEDCRLKIDNNSIEFEYSSNSGDRDDLVVTGAIFDITAPSMLKLESTATDGPRNYRVAIYYTDEGIKRFGQEWTGEASSDADARHKALEDADDRIDGWFAEVISSGPIE